MQAKIHNLKNKQGGALISALFITALAAILATALALDETLLIHESRLAIAADHAFLALDNAQDFAGVVIQQYAQQWGVNGAASLQAQLQPLKQTLTTLRIGGLVISTTIHDAQGQYNLNNLLYPQNQESFVILMRAVMPTMQQSQAQAIAASVTAWMTTGSDDKYYATLDPSYQSSKRQFTDRTELRLIRGMTPDIYLALLPYITALPVPKPQASVQQSTMPGQPIAQVPAYTTPIDVNAMTAPVLMAENPGINATQADSIIDCRKAGGVFSSVQAFMANCVVPSGVSSALQNLTATSQYFDIRTETETNHTLVWMKSLVMTQQQNNNTLGIVKVWQAFE